MLGYFRWWITFNKGVYSKRYVRWINLSIEQTFSDFEFFGGLGCTRGGGGVGRDDDGGAFTRYDISFLYTFPSISSVSLYFVVTGMVWIGMVEIRVWVNNNITQENSFFFLLPSSINVCTLRYRGRLCCIAIYVWGTGNSLIWEIQTQ